MSTDEAASGVEEASGPQVPENLAAFTGLASDPTGIDTFERYVWQAKLAIRSWLGVLAESGVLAVVCEHVEDLAIVETSGYRFAQLKTRDKGSWSAARICESGHAIEKLVASYKLAEEAGILSQSRFEVWLEGHRRNRRRHPISSPTQAPHRMTSRKRSAPSVSRVQS